MSRVIRTRLAKIGNSQGIRIPKSVIEQLNLQPEVELIIVGNHLEIRSGRKPREGWEEQFRLMAERGDDKLIELPGSSWDEDEWEW